MTSFSRTKDGRIKIDPNGKPLSKVLLEMTGTYKNGGLKVCLGDDEEAYSTVGYAPDIGLFVLGLPGSPFCPKRDDGLPVVARIEIDDYIEELLKSKKSFRFVETITGQVIFGTY